MDSPFICINHSICMILETFHMFNHGVLYNINFFFLMKYNNKKEIGSDI